MRRRIGARLLTIALGAQAGWGATLSVCSSGCTSATINQAIQAANCGDTILVAASQTHFGGDENPTANNPINLAYKSCAAGNPITITTDQFAKLPAPGTRITPSYADGVSRVIPLIENPAQGPIMTADIGNQACGGSGPSCPAHDYTIIGLEFCCAAFGYSDFISIGETANGSAEPAIAQVSDLPTNIVFDRVLVRSDPTKDMRKCLTFDGANMQILNSWIECGFDTTSSDSQGMSGYNPQNLLIRNNFISGTTETMNFSGACSPIHSPKADNCTASVSGAEPMNVEVAFNEITKPAWVRFVPWSPLTVMPKGQVVHPTVTSGSFQAQNGGTSGTNEPAWPASGETILDGTITWLNTGTVPQVKNLLEAKAVNGLNIHHNFLHVAYPQGQQGYAFTFTARTNPGAGGGTWSNIQNVTIANNLITDVGVGINSSGSDVDNDPNSYATIMLLNPAPYNITSSSNQLLLSVNGTAQTITLSTGSAQSLSQVMTDLNAQLHPGIACLDSDRLVIRASGDGVGSCGVVQNTQNALASTISVLGIANNAYTVLGLTPGTTIGCTNPRNGLWYGCGTFNGLFVHNNLWANINLAPNTAGVAYTFSIFNALRNVTFSHNTVDSHPTGGPVISVAALNFPNTNVTLLNNIFGTRGDNDHPISGLGTYYDFTAINYFFCNVVVTNIIAPVDSTCPAGVVSHNLLPGVSLWSASTRATTPVATNSGYNSYPVDNFNDAFSSVAFVNPALLDYSLAPGNKFESAATDGSSVGVDQSQIPMIRNLRVTASDRLAQFVFQLSEPIRAIPCVIRVSTDPAFAGVIADLDPSLFNQPDTSDNPANPQPRDASERIMLVGSRSPLAPGRIYYYYLGCGGASQSGQFQMRLPRRGRDPISIHRTPVVPGVASMQVTWSNSFSRSTGLQSPSTVTVACSTGQSCEATFPSPAGQQVIYQVSYLDATGSPVLTESVAALVAQ